MGEKMMTLEEMSKIQKERILSDAELVKGGADVSPEGVVIPTNDQIKDVKIDMKEDLLGRNNTTEDEKEKIDANKDNLKDGAIELTNEEKILKSFDDFGIKDKEIINKLLNYGEIIAVEMVDDDLLEIFYDNGIQEKVTVRKSEMREVDPQNKEIINKSNHFEINFKPDKEHIRAKRKYLKGTFRRI
jgi:hypothetical protein